jgi:NitT/TauT family transport system permease protein
MTVKSFLVDGWTRALTRIRVFIGIESVVLVPAEMLGVDSGLGDTGTRPVAYSELVAAILVVGAPRPVLDIAARRVFSEPTAR